MDRQAAPMDESNPYLSPHEAGRGTRRVSRLTTTTIGCVIWVATLVAGFFITRLAVDYALDGLPQKAIFEAIYRNGLALKYTLLGWGITLLSSPLVAAFAVRCARRFFT